MADPRQSPDESRQSPTQVSPEQRRDRADQEQRATRLAAIAFGVAILAGLGLVVVYINGGNTQLEGVLLAVGFGGVGLGLGVWVKTILEPAVVVEPREPMPSPNRDREALEDEFDATVDEVSDGGRRRFLLRLLAGAGASLGLAVTVPLLSLGPIFNKGARKELFETAWTQGQQLQTIDGQLLRPEELVVDSITTVFPKGADNPADAQAVLVATGRGELDASALPEPSAVVGNLVAYSKLCTHAGCPVGLYRARVGELLCPCHQSTFDVNEGAKVLSGPAGRPLPQLPIGVDDEGYLVALGDFTAPVGPSFWNMTSQRGT